MEPGKTKILFSEPVREIMGTPPRRIITWGTTVMLIIFSLCIFAAWFIEYPDIVPASIEITSLKPPVTLTARASGRLTELVVADREQTFAEELLAVVESSADYEEIGGLEEFLEASQGNYLINPDSLPGYMRLGEVQQAYTFFRQTYSKLYNYRGNDYLGQRMTSLKEEIAAKRNYILNLKTKERLFVDDLMLEATRFRRDSLLHMSGAIADAEYERSYQSLLARKIEHQQMKLDILSEQMDLSKKEQELQDVAIKRDEELQDHISALNGSRYDLLAAIDIWKAKYLIISPTDGTITLTNIWSRNQYVSEGNPVLTIVPHDHGALVGRVIMGMQKSGKVKPGMVVSIKLSGFPYLEYGIIRGVVQSVSLVPKGREYTVEISLPDGLKTIYGRELPFNQNMTGTAEIMTDDLNLLQKIVNPIRYLIMKNRLSQQGPEQSQSFTENTP